MKRLAAWGPVVAWCALIFVFSSVPDLNSGLAYDYPLRKVAHMVEYGVLALLVRRAGAGNAAAFVFSVLYAASDEWHQSFVPGRAGAASDVFIDGAGALTALVAGGILKR
ncbi:MAG: VanZ family protein [Elusimicrobiota bacterium]|nr:VanZ family protein [Elusimicrobiota bacterium]